MIVTKFSQVRTGLVFTLNNSVCKAGFFKDGPVCMKCSGNEIKTRNGNTSDCTVDPPCDGAHQLPNDEHTQCG